MVLNSKRKGSQFERDAVKLLNNKIKNSIWKRIPTSGSIGTRLNISSLTGDITGEVSGIPKKFKLEAKVGYGGATQLSIKKEWLDKIMEEAKSTYSIPGLICKFSGARSGVQEFIVLDIDTFSNLIAEMSELYEELDRIYDKKKL
jgi:Holliday junction resolvase